MHNADTLPPSCAVVTKSGNLNFLELSGPVQACNGTVFPLLYWLGTARKITYFTLLVRYCEENTYCTLLVSYCEENNILYCTG